MRITSSRVTAPVDDEPIAPNRLYGRIPQIVLALLILIVVCKWIVWSRAAERQWRAELAAAATALAPDSPTDLADRSNALFYLTRAFKGVDLSDQQMGHDFFTRPFTDETRGMLRTVIVRNENALADARRVRDSLFPTAGEREFDSANAAQWSSGERDLVNLLVYAAIDADERGGDHAAIAFLRDAVAASKAGLHCRSPQAFLFVGIGGRSIIADGLATIAGSLQLTRDRAEVLDLLASISDYDEWRSAANRASGREAFAILQSLKSRSGRQRRHVSYQCTLDGTLTLRGEAPEWLEEATSFLARGYYLLRTMHANPAPLASHPDDPSGMFAVNWIDYVSNRGSPISFALFIKQTDAKISRASIAIADRLYQIDHAGALPPSAAALVPAYLPALPAIYGVSATAPAAVLTTTPVTLPSIAR